MHGKGTEEERVWEKRGLLSFSLSPFLRLRPPPPRSSSWEPFGVKGLGSVFFFSACLFALCAQCYTVVHRGTGYRTQDKKKLELVLLRRRRRVFGTFFRPPCLPPTANEREEREGTAEEESAFAEPLPSPPHTLHTYISPLGPREWGEKKERVGE